ncbi:MAG: type I restriction endonuclease subunit R [Spirochaetales bacterium]|uniref:Type I restriction enzyme endonuclease subunit n=1 Tax=Candidatus Thalassospirochaeta sargassi TaxID=3119039 RepID=A0AAJ1IGU5_9SPIO|nr:type I restriction endonuclease subunit R [Spirochaetales bacterium]
MSISEYQEDLISLIPALKQLINLGYEYITPSECESMRGGRLHQPILDKILREQLHKINSFSFKGKNHKFTESNIEKAVQEIREVPFDSLITTNELIYDLITLGKSFEQTIEGYTKSFSLNYIDWDNPENNVFHVCDEFIIEQRHSRRTRKPDIVLFVNGIPLAVIEAKRPDKPDSIKEGISQHIRNQGVDEIPHLFVYSQLLFSIAQNQASYATAGTPEKFWSIWREEYDSTDETKLNHSINKKLDESTLTHLFSERPDWQKQKMLEIWNAGDRKPSEQDRTIYSLLRIERILELTQSFVVFDNKIKKVPRYQQYFAVKETVSKITKAKGDLPRQGGVIWHTTGSGKSITMVLLAKAISLESSIIDPRIILVTDRVDLDDQIYKTFKNCGKAVKRATSGENLFKLIEENKASIITTIIDKFEAGLRKNKLKSESRNIFVLVDESHRSQYGSAHANMKRVFPNACYIGFTGTPLLRNEKSTARKFGGFIHSYTMNQAIADRAVTPLIYEGRMSELRGDRNQIDKWFERITSDLTEDQKLDLKKRFRREEELTKSDDRLKEITYDIIQHYSQFRKSGLKGQFAVSSRLEAVKYKNCFDELGDISTEIVMSPPDTRTDHSEVDESNIPEVQRFWKSMMDRFGTPKAYQDTIIDRFHNSDDPEIIIVIHKLLTGFDEPRNGVLYIDKRLKEHNILQAIARVNRLYDGKEYGLIIDYRGIFGQLNEAIELYNTLEEKGFDREDIIGTLTTTTDEITKLHEYHTNLWAIFSEIANKTDTEAMQLHLEPEDVRHRFYETLRIFFNTLRLALSNAAFLEHTSSDTIERYKSDLKMFISLRNTIKQRFGETVDYSSYEIQIRNMVNKYIGADEVKNIIEPVDLFNIDDFERELEGIEGDAAKADTIASRMKKTIHEKMQEDPLLYKRLSEIISEAIAEHRAKRLSDAEYLNRVREAMNEMRESGGSDVPDELKKHESARPYYRLIAEELPNDMVCEKTPAYIASDVAKQVDDIIYKHKKRDWINDSSVHNKIFNDIEDYLFQIKGRYDLSWDYDAIDRIIEQSLEIAKHREL